MIIVITISVFISFIPPHNFPSFHHYLIYIFYLLFVCDLNIHHFFSLEFFITLQIPLFFYHHHHHHYHLPSFHHYFIYIFSNFLYDSIYTSFFFPCGITLQKPIILYLHPLALQFSNILYIVSHCSSLFPHIILSNLRY